MINVIASGGKGMTSIAKGHMARIIAGAASICIVTISIAIAAGMVIPLRTRSPGVRRISSIQSRAFPDFLDNSNNNQFINYTHREMFKINPLA